MTKSLNIVLAGLLITTAMPNLAAAQSSCSCSNASSATVTSVNGDVTTSNAFGFVTGEVGQVLSAGSEIYTGDGSSTNISFGPSCNLQVPARSKVVLISQPDSSSICAEVSDAVSSGANSSTAAVGSYDWVWPALLFGGGIALIATNDGSDAPAVPAVSADAGGS